MTENAEVSLTRDPSIGQNFSIYSKICSRFPVTIGEELAWQSDHIYGEVLYSALSEIFSILRRKNLLKGGEVFYDLGSGIGKAVVAAALLHDFSQCRGIELLPDLFRLSQRVQDKYCKAHRKLGKTRFADVAFFNSDILEFDWSDCDVFFINSTCFDEDFMKRISNKPLKPGTIGICTTKRLDKSKWSIIEVCRKEMSWGKATVFIQVLK